ncbi:hypothetical protein QQ045_014889 [Rhodiola kirilowii]
MIQKPLLRAKVPLNVLNFLFQSGVVAGQTKKLSLHLSTCFESGPSLKLVYKPNDASNPFTLVVKTGTGKYGSPIDSSMVRSAEFNLVGHGGAAKTVNSELWHACAGPLVSLPQIGGLVYYFPQGHSEQLHVGYSRSGIVGQMSIMGCLSSKKLEMKRVGGERS